jgi:hypothetical protein
MKLRIISSWGHKTVYKIQEAQSQPKLEGIPVISLESYIKRLAIEKHGKKHEMLQGQLSKK